MDDGVVRVDAHVANGDDLAAGVISMEQWVGTPVSADEG